MSVLQHIFLAGAALFCGAVARAEPALPPLVPHANMPGRHVCGKKLHLYERGGAYLCAVDPKLWPKRMGYAVLGTEPADEPLVADAIAHARKLTGAEIVPDPTPDLVILVQHERFDRGRIEALAANAGVTLSAQDYSLLAHGADTAVAPDQYFQGSWAGPSSGPHPRLVARFDARVGPKYAAQTTMETRRDSTRDSLREYVLAAFDIKKPASEIFDGCAMDPEAKALAADTTRVDPTVLPGGGSGGRTCVSDRVLLRRAGETYCASSPDHWPRTITYATIGPAAAAHADDVAAAVAHVERLTGRKLVAGAKPSVVLVLVDRPLDDAQIDAALTQAHITPPDGTSISASFLPALRDLMKGLARLVKTAAPGPTPTATSWGQSCFFIELEAAIRTDRPPADVRKDIDDAFLKIFQIAAPKTATPIGAK